MEEDRMPIPIAATRAIPSASISSLRAPVGGMRARARGPFVPSEEEGLTSRGRCPNELFPVSRSPFRPRIASYDTEQRDAFDRLPSTGWISYTPAIAALISIPFNPP